MKLSKQAAGAVMMALQNAILKQEDVVETILNFDLELDDDNELVVMNPPVASTMEEVLKVNDKEETDA